jgi:hypothetical protein
MKKQLFLASLLLVNMASFGQELTSTQKEVGVIGGKLAAVATATTGLFAAYFGSELVLRAANAFLYGTASPLWVPAAALGVYTVLKGQLLGTHKWINFYKAMEQKSVRQPVFGPSTK